MNMKKFIFLALMLLPVASAHAENTWHTSKVKKIYPLGNGDIVLKFFDNHLKCNNNDTPGAFYLSVNQNKVTSDGFKNMLSVVLTAAATSKEVSVYFDASSSSCYINRLFVDF